jgi:hypothetical protein
MKTLADRKEELVRLAVLEGMNRTKDMLFIDFKVGNSDMTGTQSLKLQYYTELLYTVYCEIIEDFGVLQNQYDG